MSQTTYQGFTCQGVFWFLWNTSSYFSSTGMHLRTFGSTMVMGSMVIIQSYPESIYPFICFQVLNISKKLLDTSSMLSNIFFYSHLQLRFSELFWNTTEKKNSDQSGLGHSPFRLYSKTNRKTSVANVSGPKPYHWQWLRRVIDFRPHPAGHVTLSRLWLKCAPKHKIWRPHGHVTLSRFRLKVRPKVKLWRPAGHVTSSRLWLKHEAFPKSQTLQACWPCRQKSQTLQACWPGHVVQVLIEANPKSQTLQACWQSNVINFLIESIVKSQGAKALWQIAQQCSHFVGDPCHLCNPIQGELFIRNVESLSKTKSSKQIDGHVGSGHLCPWTPKSLLLQTFMQCKPWSMGHNQPKARVGWNSVQNHLPQVATKHGVCYIQCQHAFATDA